MREVNNLSFPYIDNSRPLGTQMVSTIDDAERETRSWLKQCMEEITDYPNSNIRITSWTTAQRPTNSGEGYLLGYNQTEGCLELVGADVGGTPDIKETLNLDIKKEIALLAHPVGEYYWTSNTSFNPNTAWGGTWERIQDGRVLISDNNNHAVGSTGGEEEVTLVEEELPQVSHEHSHDRGTMNITGSFGYVEDNNAIATGAFTKGAYRKDVGGNVENGIPFNFDASLSWTGETSLDEFSFGSGLPHNNMQPYRVAVCWHRTA